MRSFIALLLGSFLISVALPAMAADDHVGVGPAPTDGMNMSPIVSQQEFERMQSLIDPRVRSGERQPSETAGWQYLWYCAAQSQLTGNWYYWYSYNAYYARNQALSACVAINGYTCSVGCQISY